MYDASQDLRAKASNFCLNRKHQTNHTAEIGTEPTNGRAKSVCFTAQATQGDFRIEHNNML